jgi:hypothetical protein
MRGFPPLYYSSSTATATLFLDQKASIHGPPSCKFGRRRRRRQRRGKGGRGREEGKGTGKEGIGKEEGHKGFYPCGP